MAHPQAIDTWRLGWNFTAGESLRQAPDIFTDDIVPITLTNSTVQLQTFSPNNSIPAFQWRGVSFLAYKSSMMDPDNPYGVRHCSFYLSDEVGIFQTEAWLGA